MAGEAVRLVVQGAPSVVGRTMAGKLAWLRRHGEDLRRFLMLEPRGHAAMHGALLTEPVSPGAHAGILFMHAGGFPLFSGDGIIAAVTLALEHKLILVESEELLIDTPVGLVAVRARRPGGRIEGIEATSVPAFVFAPGVEVRLGSRAVRVDIAYGGEFYAIVDSESVGVPVDMAHGPELLRAGVALIDTVEASSTVVHPLEKAWTGIQGVVFTAPPGAGADLRTATVLDGGVLRRSPGVAGTCALLAVLDAMGLVSGGQVFTNEGLVGTTLRARIESRHMSNDVPFVVPVVDGSAAETGRHEFVADEEG